MVGDSYNFNQVLYHVKYRYFPPKYRYGIWEFWIFDMFTLRAMGTYASYSSLTTLFPQKLSLVVPTNIEVAPVLGAVTRADTAETSRAESRTLR